METEGKNGWSSYLSFDYGLDGYCASWCLISPNGDAYWQTDDILTTDDLKFSIHNILKRASQNWDGLPSIDNLFADISNHAVEDRIRALNSEICGPAFQFSGDSSTYTQVVR